MVDRIEMEISFTGDLSEDQFHRLFEIAIDALFIKSWYRTSRFARDLQTSEDWGIKNAIPLGPIDQIFGFPRAIVLPASSGLGGCCRNVLLVSG
jgi:hypothetical protein